MRIGYARVSTLDQNPDLQEQKLREAGCERVVVERASGAKADRPELNRLLDDILRPGDTLVVWKLDRLARSLKHLIETAEMLKGRGIGFVSLTDAIDTASPGGMLVFHVLGAIAEFERALIRERQREGIALARQRGAYRGRKKALAQEQVAELRQRAAAGEKKAQLARGFGISRETLYQYLRTDR